MMPPAVACAARPAHYSVGACAHLGCTLCVPDQFVNVSPDADCSCTHGVGVRVRERERVQAVHRVSVQYSTLRNSSQHHRCLLECQHELQRVPCSKPEITDYVHIMMPTWLDKV
jgi:hypothetical protein